MLIRILAVDSNDPNKVYLRIFDNGFIEQLGVYDHASGKLELPLQLEHRMSAFLLRSDGAVVVATQDGAAFISTDDAQSFAPWQNVPHLRAIGERDGLLYAAANDAVDGYAVGVSSDLGASWQPLVSFAQVKGPLSCGNIAERCAIPWQNFLATIAMSAPEDPLPGFDLDSGPDSNSLPPARNPSGSGCRCSAPASGQRSQGSGFAALALVAAFRVRRRRS
jgi:MYXO-CTERM domain-containing protein